MNRRQSPCSTLSREERRLGSDPSSYYSKGRAHEAHGKYLLTRRIFTTLIQPYAVSMEMPRHHSYRGETKLQPGRQPGSGSWTPNPQAGGPAQGPGPLTPQAGSPTQVLHVRPPGWRFSSGSWPHIQAACWAMGSGGEEEVSVTGQEEGGSDQSLGSVVTETQASCRSTAPEDSPAPTAVDYGQSMK